jgi:hypothetical protein
MNRILRCPVQATLGACPKPVKCNRRPRGGTMSRLTGAEGDSIVVVLPQDEMRMSSSAGFIHSSHRALGRIASAFVTGTCL